MYCLAAVKIHGKILKLDVYFDKSVGGSLDKFFVGSSLDTVKPEVH